MTSNIKYETLEDALDDVHTRFILNLPPQELATSDRLFFQIEQAWWFYEDLICDGDGIEASDVNCNKGNDHLQRFSTLKPFALKVFELSPILETTKFHEMWNQFSDYKRKISTYGTILLNKEANQIALVRVYDGNTWTLPAGKINQGEKGFEAAARETYEETGFDPHCIFGLVKDQYPDVAVAGDGGTYDFNTVGSAITPPWHCPLREKDALSYQDNNGKRRTAYVCQGVPLDFPFAPVARKEVSEIKWFDLDEIPKKTFAVLPLMGKLRGWIRKRQKHQKKRDKSRSKSNKRDKSNQRDKSNPRDKSNGRDKSAGRDKSTGRKAQRRRSSAGGGGGRNSSRSRVINNEDDPLIDSGLATVGDTTRWSEDDMFKVNEQLIGKKVEYDGNPHVFSEKGFAGVDPHAFRVVGGTFMNSDTDAAAIDNIIVNKESQASKYQPLGNSVGVEGDALPLTPFFTDDGLAPWEKCEEAAGGSSGRSSPADNNSNNKGGINPGVGLLAMLQKNSLPSENEPTKQQKEKKSSNKSANKKKSYASAAGAAEEEPKGDDVSSDPLDVLTDSQITKRSQDRFLGSNSNNNNRKQRKELLEQQYVEDQKFIDEWVSQLPNPGGFKIQNIDTILQKAFG